MDTPANRILRPARLAALALIAILVAGLAYLRLGLDPGSVSVPAGAQAGDLSLASCEYATEDGDYAADCGTLVVPENRADPRSRLIALPVTRVRARSEPAGQPIFRLEGGPGLTNMDFPAIGRFADRHDVVLVGYRGVDGSSVLDCPEVSSALARSTDLLAEQTSRAYGDAFRACAERLSGEGVDLAGYSLAQRVDDLEDARVALGYGRVNLLSESAGTRTAMIYSWRHPASIHRSVMIGANPPGHFVWDPATTDEQIRRYADLCAADGGCRDRTGDLSESMRRTASQLPDRWLFFPIKDGNVRVASFLGLSESTSESPVAAPATLDSWLSAAEGDPSGLWFMSVAADLVLPQSFVWGEYAATGRIDAPAAARHFATGQERDSILGDPGTTLAWGRGELADSWPATPDDDEYRQPRTSEVETLVIGGTLDFSTPPQVATEELLPFLPNGRQVVLAELGHTTDFWTYHPEAGSRLINTFLDSGEVEEPPYPPVVVEFTPVVTQTMLAKTVAGTIAGLALLALLALLWMARRVRRRGGFGGKAGAALRLLSPAVLGLGGWSLGVLVVLTALPGVPLDHELLAAFAGGLPVGVGAFLAWVNRAWSANRRTTGLVAAMAGSLAGAWLGFHATAGLLGLLTAIAAAAAGANLILIALDIVTAGGLGRDQAPARGR